MKGVIVHALLSLFGLAFAYQTWTREDEVEAPAGEVTIVDCAEDQLASVEVETPTQRVVARATKEKGDAGYWVTSQRKPKEPAKEPAKPSEPAPKPARAVDPDAPLVFLANAKLADVVKKVAPLRAVRGLGEVPKAKFAAFGLDKVETRLRLQCGSRKVELELGGRTFGKSDQYARDPKTKQVYLLDGQIVSDLQSAQYKFMQNELHAFPLTEVDQATVKAVGMERKLAHRNRLVPAEARWVDASAPDRRNELFGNFFQRVGRLRAKTYLAEGAAPGGDLQIKAGAAKPVATIAYQLEGKEKGKLEIVRVDTEKENFYYLRSEATGGRWVSTYDSVAKQIEDDLAMVVGAEEPPPQSPAKPASEPPPSLPPGHPPLRH